MSYFGKELSKALFSYEMKVGPIIAIYGFLISCQTCKSIPILNAIEDRPYVYVEEGIIKGLKETQEGVEMFTFRGIPYAQPPVNELRFMPPVPVEPWGYELDASILPSSCPQVLSGKEDCLFLNVYTPANKTGPLAVMVFIHGGGFVLGSASIYDKTYPLVQHDVIVVNIQYRIGILGFFSTGDNVAPGNQGLKDQTLALTWIKNNIAAFGGDPDRITLFGQSAGSASAHYQVLTPYAQGLFNNYILMSGNAFMPWAQGRGFYEISRDLARRNDCPENPSYDLVVCLQQVKNYIKLNDMQAFYIDWNFQTFKFGPRVDGDYIPDDPVTLVKNGQYNEISSMMGVVKNEMALETGELYAKPKVLDSLVNNFDANGPVSVMLYPDEDPLNTANQVYDYYVGGSDVDDSDADNLTKLFTDGIFHVPFDWLVQRQADVVDTYSYELDYRGTYGLSDSYANIGLNISTSPNWISHADDLQYIFEQDPPGKLTDPDDMNVSCLYTLYFTNFAKYGNPTPESGENICSTTIAEWEKADGTAIRHLSITPSPSMQPDTRQDVRTFWESLPLRINALL